MGGRSAASVGASTKTGQAQATSASALSKPAQPAQPNIIFIVADSLRADHLSSYDYTRTTTPQLDQWVANAGVVFSDTTSAAAWTFPSAAAFMSGRLPARMNVRWAVPGSTVPVTETLLAEALKDAGYYTAGFVTAFYARRAAGFGQGFDTFHDVIGTDGIGTRATQLNTTAQTWLDTTWTTNFSGTKPLFLYLYYFDPHTWYAPPVPFDTQFDATYTGPLTGEAFSNGTSVISGTIELTARDLEHIVALYDGEIAYWDAKLGELMAYLDSKGLLSNSITVITSDHGQMFGEHGKWVHRNSLYEEVLRVPMLMRYTGVISAGVVVTAPVQPIDIFPTVLDLANIPFTPTLPLDGVSLKALALGQPYTQTRNVFSEQGVDALGNPEWFAPRYALRSVRADGWKLIQPLGPAGISSTGELYNLRPASQYEVDDRFAAETARVAVLRQTLTDKFGPSPNQRFVFLPVSLR
jgi:arylsulfatase A-like enzyme